MTHAIHEPHPVNVIGYDLSRRLPEMERGFTIHTNYGDIEIHAEDVQRYPSVIQAIERVLNARLKDAIREWGKPEGWE